MCGIWDWQSTIVKDLNDSQDPKHTLFCRKIVFVAIYALFSDKCPLFTRLGGGSPKADIVRFFYRFSYRVASLRTNPKNYLRVRTCPRNYLRVETHPRIYLRVKVWQPGHSQLKPGGRSSLGSICKW